jgi:hypothetical protein
MVENGPAPPHGRYKRGLQGANFTLEARTESVPDDDKYYVLQDGEILLETAEFAEATARYNELCREFWKVRLADPVPQVRVAAAWGLLGLEPTDKNAITVITEDGTPQERKRLEQAQSRRRALRGRTPSAR